VHRIAAHTPRNNAQAICFLSTLKAQPVVSEKYVDDCGWSPAVAHGRQALPNIARYVVLRGIGRSGGSSNPSRNCWFR